jgi:flagellar basal-body rod protein FlgC
MSDMSAAVSGLEAAIEQLNVSASNIANSQTTGVWNAEAATLGASTLGASALGASATAAADAASPTGSNVAPPMAYRPLQLVQYANADMAGGGVSTRVEADSPAVYAAYAPSVYYANADGIVATPNIDLPAQIINEASALIQFEANLKVIEAGDQMQESVINQKI